jgi:hypothetical protein
VTQWVPGGQYCAEQLPAQSLAAHEFGLNDVEQQCDQHKAVDAQLQNQWPPTGWHFWGGLSAGLQTMPQAPQSLSTFVWIGLPPQQRAVSSPAVQL